MPIEDHMPDICITTFKQRKVRGASVTVLVGVIMVHVYCIYMHNDHAYNVQGVKTAGMTALRGMTHYTVVEIDKCQQIRKNLMNNS